MGKKVRRWRGKLADEESNVPRAGALSETMALPRLWRGGDDRLRSLGWGGVMGAASPEIFIAGRIRAPF